MIVINLLSTVVIVIDDCCTVKVYSWVSSNGYTQL